MCDSASEQERLTQCEEITMKLLHCCYSTNPCSDPETWKDVIGDSPAARQAQQQSQLIQTIATETSFYSSHLASSQPSSSSSFLEMKQQQVDDSSSTTSAAAATSTSKQEEGNLMVRQESETGNKFRDPDRLAVRYRMRHNGILRRIVVAKVVFRAILQPVISNILVAAFKGSADSTIEKVMNLVQGENTENQESSSSSEKEKTENAIQSLRYLASVVIHVSSIRAKNTLLKVLYEKQGKGKINNSSSNQEDSVVADQENTSNIAPCSPSLHGVVALFMKAAGFEHISPSSSSSSSDNNNFLDGSWEWLGGSALKHFLQQKQQQKEQQEKQEQEQEKEMLKQCALQVQDALSKVRFVEKHVLSVFETHFEKGGLLAVDTVNFLDEPWLLETFVVQQQNNNINENENLVTQTHIQSLLDDWKKKREQIEHLHVVGNMLDSKTQARFAAQEQEQKSIFEKSRQQAVREKEAHEKSEQEAKLRRQRETEEFERELEKVQHLLPQARETLHKTGRVRNASFQGYQFRIQPLSMSTRIQACNCETSGVEVHWHLRAAPNVLYAFTAHLNKDATEFWHLGDEIGYQYGTVPGLTHFGKTTQINRKEVDHFGVMLKIHNEVKPVHHCVCGLGFDVLWD